MWIVAFVLFLWGVLAIGAWTAFPTGWRAVGAYSSYTLYLVFLMLLWVALLAVTFIGVFIPVAYLDKWLKQWLGDTDRRGAELAAVVGYAVLVSAIAWVVPPAAVLVMCLSVAVGAWFVYLPKGRDGAAVLWRSGPDKPIYAVPVHRVLAIVALLASLLLFDVLMTACGGRLFGPPRSDDTMPVTALFGAVAAWLLPLLLAVIALRLRSARRTDPARHLHGTHRSRRCRRSSGSIGRHAVRAWAGAFVLFRNPAAGNRWCCGGCKGKSEATEFDHSGRLGVRREPRSRRVKQRLDRRDEIQVRRQLFRGLQKLFKRASAFKRSGRRWVLAGSSLVVLSMGSVERTRMPIRR